VNFFYESAEEKRKIGSLLKKKEKLVVL